MLQNLIIVYNSLHLYAGYDGYLSVKNMQEGLKAAYELINWVYNQIKNKI